MREILFRGKREDSGEWIEGFLLSQKGKYYISSRPSMCLAGISAKHGDFYGFEEWYEVKPETVGQFTGLKDKNGVKIFEGDVVRYGRTNEAVVYNDGGFSPFSIAGWECTPYWNESEVIGNIHDNPELLRW